MHKKDLTKCTVLRTLIFSKWFLNLNIKTQHIINSRLQRIILDNHWGTTNYFDEIIELKWKSGLRIYCFRKESKIILLLGGNKNGQSKDIKKAKKIIQSLTTT